MIDSAAGSRRCCDVRDDVGCVARRDHGVPGVNGANRGEYELGNGVFHDEAFGAGTDSANDRLIAHCVGTS